MSTTAKLKMRERGSKVKRTKGMSSSLVKRVKIVRIHLLMRTVMLKEKEILLQS